MKSCPTILTIGLCLLCFLGGFLVYPLYKQVTSFVGPRSEIHELDNEFSFINPLLQCEGGEMLQHHTGNFKHIVLSYVDHVKSIGSVSDIAVYYRNLNNGPWFGINEREKFLPASLLKVPMLISFLQDVEMNPQFAEEKILFSESAMSYDVFFPPKEQIQKNNTYTLQELAERMIIYSDNDAALLLAKRVGPDRVAEIYKDLGIQVQSDGSDFMTTKEYGSFFRILYNASYLSKPFSEAALSLLAQTEFNQGLVAGVPSTIRVSHKFGERMIDGQNLKQLHDCGIIYFPNDPYLLCVMTRGENINTLAKTIQDVSRIVYEEVEKQSKK